LHDPRPVILCISDTTRDRSLVVAMVGYPKMAHPLSNHVISDDLE